MYGCMDVNRVLNEICTQLGMLRCKIHVVVFLGEPNTENLCLLGPVFWEHQVSEVLSVSSTLVQPINSNKHILKKSCQFHSNTFEMNH